MLLQPWGMLSKDDLTRDLSTISINHGASRASARSHKKKNCIFLELLGFEFKIDRAMSSSMQQLALSALVALLFARAHP